MAPPTPTTDYGPDVAQTRAELAALRPELDGPELDGPELGERFESALPGARTAVLSRLLGALVREPLPGVVARGYAGDTARVTLADRRVVEFPAAAALPFAEPGPGLSARIHEPSAGAGRWSSLDDPVSLVRALWPTGTLVAEVANSVANLALARAGQPGEQPGDPQAARVFAGPAHPPGHIGALAAAAGDPDGLGRLEQLVVDGHPLHPGCRTRIGMTVADVLAYAPEHRPVIRLRRLHVPPGRWYGDAPPILYAHPWQAEHLRDSYPWLTDAGETTPVRPLMSLRTVAPLDGGDHYKTAVDVQMTSAVRTVSPAAVHNGPRLSALLRTLTADLPLSVLAETAAGAVIVDGRPDRHLAHLRRQAPRIGTGETVLPLGALAVPGLLGEAVRDDPYRWFGDLAPILWTPLVTVLDRGVALEAHGQNTLVVLRDGRPIRILYRDLGGVRVSARRLRAAGLEAPDVHGDLADDDPRALRTKLSGAALGTVAAQLITLLARHHDADPARLWPIVAAAVRAAGTADAAALLRDPLPIKATTAMRLARDPLDDLWASTANPMAEYA